MTKFSETMLTSKVSLCMKLLATLFIFISFWSTMWVSAPGYNFGVWKECYVTGCMAFLDVSPSSSMRSSQAFGTLGFICSLVPLTSLFSCMFIQQFYDNHTLFKIAFVTSAMAGVCIRITVVLFGSKARYDQSLGILSHPDLSWAFALTALALILQLFGSVTLYPEFATRA